MIFCCFYRFNISIFAAYKIKGGGTMLIIPVKEGENIERALKKYKKKFERTGVIKQLRARKEFIKPSVLKRQQIIKASYKEYLRNQEL